MYRWGLPLGCLFLTLALVAGILTLRWLDGIGMRVGVGVAGLLFYAAVMCVHYFERSSCPVDRGQAKSTGRS